MSKNSRSEHSTVDLDFISIRHKLLDVAAFLDRADRYQESTDFRVQALVDALPFLTSLDGDRAKKILEHFSDPSTEPIETAPGKGACGTNPPEKDA